MVVVFLQGGRPTFGPKAAEVAGRMYSRLYNHQYFQAKTTPLAVSANRFPPRSNGQDGRVRPAICPAEACPSRLRRFLVLEPTLPGCPHPLPLCLCPMAPFSDARRVTE